MGKRRVLGIDADLAELLKQVTKDRGTTVSSYLRELLKESIEIEKLGYYAPIALKEKRIEYLLENLGFVYIPRNIVLVNTTKDGFSKGEKPSNIIADVGRRIASIISEVGIDPIDLIEFLSKMLPSVLIKFNELIIIAPPNDVDNLILELIKHISRSSGLQVNENNSIVSIKIPEERTLKSISSFKRRKFSKNKDNQ